MMGCGFTTLGRSVTMMGCGFTSQIEEGQLQ